MTHQEVERFFKEYIFGFIKSDIQREIDLARAHKPAGNFLSALGLLCYTEFVGGIALGGFEKAKPKKRFDTFFKSMGKSYEDLNKRINVYDIFRCGMAHQYFIKRNCTIATYYIVFRQQLRQLISLSQCYIGGQAPASFFLAPNLAVRYGFTS